MEKFDSIILITPNIGEYSNNDLFLRPINFEEIEFFENPLFEYKNKHDSYSECIKDLKDKMTKIKKILEE